MACGAPRAEGFAAMSDTDKPDDQPEDQRPGDASAPALAAASAGGGDAPGRATQPGGDDDRQPSRPTGRGARGAWAVAIIALIVALLSAGDSVYLWYRSSQSLDRMHGQVTHFGDTLQNQSQQVSQRLSDFSQRLSQLSHSLSRIGDVVQTQQQQAQQLNHVQSQMGQLSHRISTLSDLLHSSERTWDLVQIQHLLVVANDRLQLNQDVRGAISALDIAQTRLAQADDPGLIPVRQAVSQELQALHQVQQVDLEGMAITLSTLAKNVTDLPLQQTVPTHYTPPSGQSESPSAKALAWWQRGLQSAEHALEHMVSIRRTEKPTPALMAPSHEFFLYQNLQLKLEAARTALLQRRTQVFRDSLQTARRWLGRYFKADSQAVQSMQQKLSAMGQQDLNPKLPDISESLQRLHQRLQKLRQAAAAPAGSGAGGEPASGQQSQGQGQ